MTRLFDVLVTTPEDFKQYTVYQPGIMFTSHTTTFSLDIRQSLDEVQYKNIFDDSDM